MTIKKRGLSIFASVIVLIFSVQGVFALGVAPAHVGFNFEPGREESITYTVSGSATKQLEVYAKGELAEYITFDKTTVSNGGSFTATIKLPEKLEKPGRLLTYVGVKEKRADDELASGQIGTAIIIEVLISVYVPYPGRYLEADLISKDVNVGEPVNFGLNIVSKGTEDLTVNPRIEVLSGDGIKIEELSFRERLIKSQEVVELTKTLETTNYNPGSYKALAIVDYGGETAQDEEEFRIGTLIINIVGYTPQIVIGKLEKFDIGIESGWNDNIDGVYADVAFLNNTGEATKFKTTTTSLIPWEGKNITGFFETTNFTEGFYDANITLFYFGRERGASNSETVQVEFIKPPGLSSAVYLIAGGIGLLIIIIFLGIKYFRKNGTKKHRKR